jgi:peptide/nickel transport system permease protein
MLKYLCKRLLLFIPIFLGVTFIVFFIMEFIPGDPVRLILGDRRTTPEAMNLLREQLGLNRPFLVRYADYVWGMVSRLDFGSSWRLRTPVITDIVKKFPATLHLAFMGMFFASLIGISAGVFSAIRQYSPADTIATTTAMFFASIPNFWLGMMLILLFSLRLGLLPSNGFSSWRHYILPVTALTLPGSAGLLRLTRSMMLETIRQDYIRTARAKGAGEGSVIIKHALKNAMLPIITSMGLHFGNLLGGAIITETVFAIPGLGTHIINAIRQKDTPVVLASTVFLSVFFSLVMLLIDVSYAFLDPRIRVKYSRRER